MIPTEKALADMAEVAPLSEDLGDPFAWIEPGDWSPEGASRGPTGVRSAERASEALPEPDGGTAQRGVQRRGAGNGGA